MTRGGDDPPVELVGRRLEFLELLSDGSVKKRAIADRLDCSRSTVDRAVRELSEAGLIERRDGGHATTLAGRIAAERYRDWLADSADVFEAAEVLAPLSPDCEVDAAVVAGAEARLAAGPTPYRPVEEIHEAVREADRYRAVLPALDDPRHLRLCYEHVVSGGRRATLVVDRDLLGSLREEFPRRLAVMAGTDRFEVRAGDVPPYGLVLADRDGETTVHLLVFDDDGAVHGVLRNDAAAAVRWALGTFRRAADGAARVTDRLAAAAGDGADLPPELAAEGFVTLSTDYFLDRPVAEPTDAWRAGLDLAEVQAGYPIERTLEEDSEDEDGSEGGDGPTTLTDHLTDRLRAGVDCAALGPPGSGKSTACKQVACEWYREGDPVLYRESGGGRRFESVDALADAVAATDGRPLVVVEDAVRPEAHAVFDAMDAVGDGAAFLLDARRSEWTDPPGEPTGRIDRERVETVRMPPLLGRDCERLAERFARTVGTPDEVPVERIRAGILDARDTDEGPRPGEALLFTHRLAAYVDPLTDAGPTTLEADARALYERLAAASDPAPEVGVLVNLLNAAGVAVHPEYVRALAVRGDGGRGATAAVEAALDRLDGGVLFGRSEDGSYRTVHESWSAAFLAEASDVDDETAAECVGRALTRLLALADDPAARRQVRAAVDRPGALDRIADAPGEWAEEVLEAVYTFAARRPKFGPLLPDVDDGDDGDDGQDGRGGAGDDGAPGGDGTLVLPAACGPETRVLLARWRGTAYHNAGMGDRTAAAFDRMLARLEDAADALPDERVEALRATAVHGTGLAANCRGDLETAERACRRALATYEAVGDLTGESDCLNSLGMIADRRGDWETAVERYERSLERARRIGDDRRIASRLLNLGIINVQQGNHDAAESYLRDAAERAREIGAIDAEAQALNNLGLVARDRGNLATAESRFRVALGRKRELGLARDEALALWNLAEVARRRGELADAADYAERARDRYDDVGDEVGVAKGRVVLAHVRHDRGEPGPAIDLAERALDALRDGTDRLGEASARIVLGKALRADGALEEAARHLGSASDLCADLGTPLGRAWCLRQRGLLAADRGDPGTAVDRLRAALDVAREPGLDRTVADINADLGRLARRRGEAGTARSRLAAAAETYRACDAPRDALDALDALADVCERLDDRAAAIERCEEAVELATTRGLDDEGARFRERCRRLERAIGD